MPRLSLLPRSDSAAAHGRAPHHAVADRLCHTVLRLGPAEAIEGARGPRVSLVCHAPASGPARARVTTPARPPVAASASDPISVRSRLTRLIADFPAGTDRC